MESNNSSFAAIKIKAAFIPPSYCSRIVLLCELSAKAFKLMNSYKGFFRHN